MKLNKLRFTISLTLVLLLLLGVSLFLKWKVPCPILHLTGFYCPSCGISRMLIALFHGKFYQAFRYNPLLFCLLPFFLILGMDAMNKWIHDRSNYIVKRIPKSFWYALLVVFLLFAVARNLPLFDFLKPTLIGLI